MNMIEKSIDVLDDGNELIYVPGHDEAIPLRDLTQEELKEYRESCKSNKPEQ